MMTNGTNPQTWSGILMTAKGRRIRLELELSREGAKVHGTCQYNIVADERIEAYSARVEGEWSNDGDVTLHLSFDGSEPPANLSGRQEPLDEHAEAVIYGTYERATSNGQEHGVFIVWRYAEPR